MRSPKQCVLPHRRSSLRHRHPLHRGCQNRLPYAPRQRRKHRHPLLHQNQKNPYCAHGRKRRASSLYVRHQQRRAQRAAPLLRAVAAAAQDLPAHAPAVHAPAVPVRPRPPLRWHHRHQRGAVTAAVGGAAGKAPVPKTADAAGAAVRAVTVRSGQICGRQSAAGAAVHASRARDVPSRHPRLRLRLHARSISSCPKPLPSKISLLR